MSTLALEDGDLMAQDQDLGVLGAVRPGEQPGQLRQIITMLAGMADRFATAPDCADTSSIVGTWRGASRAHPCHAVPHT